MASADKYSGCGSGTIIVIVVAVGVIYMLAQCIRPVRRASLDAMLQSDRFPMEAQMDYDWSVRGLDGQVLNMAETKGKVIFLNVWATWCPPCRAEMPSIQSLYDKIKEEGVVFVLVSNEDLGTVREYVEAQGYSMPVYTASGPLPSVLSTRGIPTTFIVSPQGKVVLKYVGGADWDSPVVLDFLRRVKGANRDESLDGARDRQDMQDRQTT